MNQHPTLYLPMDEPLTVREARLALRSKEITKVQVPVRLIFGDEEQEIIVPKSAILMALPPADEYGDETTELRITHQDTIQL